MHFLAGLRHIIFRNEFVFNFYLWRWLWRHITSCQTILGKTLKYPVSIFQMNFFKTYTAFASLEFIQLSNGMKNVATLNIEWKVNNLLTSAIEIISPLKPISDIQLSSFSWLVHQWLLHEIAHLDEWLIELIVLLFCKPSETFCAYQFEIWNANKLYLFLADWFHMEYSTQPRWLGCLVSFVVSISDSNRRSYWYYCSFAVICKTSPFSNLKK